MSRKYNPDAEIVQHDDRLQTTDEPILRDEPNPDVDADDWEDIDVWTDGTEELY